MKGVFYVAIGITGAAFGKQTAHPVPPSMAKAFAPIPSPPGWDTIPTLGLATPLIAPPPPRERVVVMTRGNGGRIDDHRTTFEPRNGTKVELRGPCYSACTLILGYLERDKLCIAPGAFMAFHAVRGEAFGQYMPGETRKMYETYLPEIRRWIDHSGGWHNLPIDGFWTMYDHSLWAIGYPRCAP